MIPPKELYMPGMLMLLLSAVYGLLDAPLCWWATLVRILMELGFIK